MTFVALVSPRLVFCHARRWRTCEVTRLPHCEFRTRLLKRITPAHRRRGPPPPWPSALIICMWPPPPWPTALVATAFMTTNGRGPPPPWPTALVDTTAMAHRRRGQLCSWPPPPRPTAAEAHAVMAYCAHAFCHTSFRQPSPASSANFRRGLLRSWPPRPWPTAAAANCAHATAAVAYCTRGLLSGTAPSTESWTSPTRPRKGGEDNIQVNPDPNPG